MLGTSDMGGRTVTRRPIRVRTDNAPQFEAPEVTENTSTAPVEPRKSSANAPTAQQAELALPKAEQPEFGFGELESRGNFEKTDRYLFDGQDLDVPTYLRKGLKNPDLKVERVVPNALCELKAAESQKISQG